MFRALELLMQRFGVRAREQTRSTHQLAGLLNERYDRQTIEVMSRVLRIDSTAVDIGAHGGAILAEMVVIAPEGIHYAFEPLPELARKLRLRFPNVRVHECALSDARGESSFEHVINDPGYSGLRRREYDRPDPRIERITVSTDTLDNLLPPELHVDFIKIDVEGGEYHAMLGGFETIMRSRPVIVFEASARSTGLYGVTAAQLYEFVTVRCEMKLSTIKRWLSRQEPYTHSEFCSNWEFGPEFYFIAYP